MIRSHGVTRREQEELTADGLRVVDATCPFVKKIHKLVQEYSEKGYYVVIIGSGDHPEVQGIVGWSDETRTSVISTVDEAQNLDLKPWKKVCIVAQTTFNYNKFQELIEIIQKKGYDSESTVDKDKKLLFTIRYAMPPRNVRKRQENFWQSGCNVSNRRDKQLQYKKVVMKSALKNVEILTYTNERKI